MKTSGNLNNLTMRDVFFDKVYDIAAQNRQVILISDDFGAPSLDKFSKDLSSQYIHIGIAEQNMVSVAAGMALGGKTVLMYGIAPFMTLRCYEQIKLDLCCLNLAVTAVGVGAGYGYSTAGPTHHATDDIAIMRALPNITILSPSDNVMVTSFAKIACINPGPKYIRLEREKLPLLYCDRDNGFSEGLAVLKTGLDLTIVATGIMVHQALEVAEELSKQGIEAGVVDYYRIKPVNEQLLLQVIEQSRRIVTLEENLIIGGIGSIVAEVLADNAETLPLKRIGIQDRFCFKYADREHVQSSMGLDVDSITRNILAWLK